MWILSLKFAEKVFAAAIHAAWAAAAFAPKLALKFAVKVGVMTSAPKAAELDATTAAATPNCLRRSPVRVEMDFIVAFSVRSDLPIKERPYPLGLGHQASHLIHCQGQKALTINFLNLPLGA